jgi:hypothetical protein
MLPSSFHFDEASRFDATGRLHFISARPARDDGSLPRINHFAAQALEWRGVARDDSMAA